MPRSRTGLASKSSSLKRTEPLSAVSSPAITRSSVVLPEPEGPSSARNSPSSASSDTDLSTGERPKDLRMSVISRDIEPSSTPPLRRQLIGELHLQHSLHRKRDQCKKRKQRGDRERRHEIVLVIEDLHMERHGRGLAPNEAGDDGDCAELPHRPRRAQQHTVHERPFDVG